MAAFQFSVEQVSFSPDDLVTETSSIDSLNSVVDPNVDFVVENLDLVVKKTYSQDVAEEWKTAAKYSPPNYNIILKKNKMEGKDDSISSPELSPSKIVDSETVFNSKPTNPSYPTISLPVANCMNQNNPTLCEEAEKYLNSESFLRTDSERLTVTQQNISPSSPLHSMCLTSEALALQQSVIGNLGVKPVSADIVAQVVESTKLRLQQAAALSSSDVSTFDHSTTKKSSVYPNEHKDFNSTNKSVNSQNPELIRYPSESISSVVERRSWFSKTPVQNSNVPIKSESRDSSRQKYSNRRSTSQSSINSIGSKRNYDHRSSNVPGVHSAKGSVPSKDNCAIDQNFDSPYEQSLDNSIGYETESSVSEKYEVESLCSEAYETESNISELSGIGDEMFQLGKLSDSSMISIGEHNAFENKSLTECGTQVNAVTSNATTSPLKSITSNRKPETSNKYTLTEEHYFFEMLREKASLEGKLENITKENNDLLKERDNWSMKATNLEAQVQSLQNQLEISVLEKKNALKNLDAQTKEHRNWDNVIKEYQNIIEGKNSEIKGLKDDLSESEQANIQSKVCYEELKVDMESKDGAVLGLKKKIAELHVQVQLLLEGKTQLKNDVSNVHFDMETLKKSKDWYQEQLHITQENRNKLHQQLISVQANEANLSNSLERATSEINQLKQQLTETQHKAVKEKEVLMKHLETIEADMMERESMFEEIQKDKGSVELVLAERIRKVETEKSKLTNMTFTISDLEHQISVLKLDIGEKDKLLASIEKEKAQLSKRIVILQKSSNEKDLNIQQIMQQMKDLSIKMSHTEMALARSEELVSNLNEEKTAIDVALAAANEEKRVVDESLKVVGENLNKFKNNFKHMKAELLTKSAQAEQLLKEKNILEESLRKNEASLFFLKKEFVEKMDSENHNRDVMFDDMVKQMKDLQNILDVYSKDLLNYQQCVKNLENQKNYVENELSHLKNMVKCSDDKINDLNKENINLKENLATNFEKNLELQKCTVASKFKDKGLQIDSVDQDQTIQKLHFDYKKKIRMYKSNIKILSQKLKEKMSICESLSKEIKKKEELELNNQQLENCSCQLNNELLELQLKYTDLEKILKEQQVAYEEQANLIKKNEEIIIELEREKGKATGLADSYNAFKLRASELEAKSSGKDSHIAQLDCLVKELNNRIAEHTQNAKEKLASMEVDLNKEKALVKSLRQQIFQGQRVNSQLQRQLSSQKSALEQANHFADAKKQEIDVLQAELSLKVQAELQHRAKEEQFQTEINFRQAEYDKLMKEMEEVKSRDPALAEQIKSLSWHLKEKNNEASALKEKQKLIEERHLSEVEALKISAQNAESELANVKKELTVTRKERFNYQAKVVELRKALKIKLGQLEEKGVLKIENKKTSNGSFIELNIPDPETSFDESYINSLLEKSMNLAESRPLNNLQECLNSLKEEMVQLQKKIINADAGS